MSRKHRCLVMLTFTVGFLGLAIGAAAVALDRNAASDSLLPVPVADPPSTPKLDRDDIVCPGIILGKGVDLKVTIPCTRGAAIMEATAVAVDGRYCARVTYRAETESPSRTETLCEGDEPSVGGEPVRPFERGGVSRRASGPETGILVASATSAV